MGAFSPDWLALREPADADARSARLTRLVGGALPHDLVHALDLGTGTGANVRYLADRLPVRQDWLLVDDDPRLIEEAARMCASGVVRRVDLVAEIDSTGARHLRRSRARDGLGAPGSRVGALAARAGRQVPAGGRRGAVRAHLRRRDSLPAGGARGRDDSGSGESTPAERQGIRPGPGSGGCRRRRAVLSPISAITSNVNRVRGS